MAKTWFVTGASRGLGAEITKSAQAAGDKVIATARKAADILPLPPKSPELNPVENPWLFMRENWLSNRVSNHTKI